MKMKILHVNNVWMVVLFVKILLLIVFNVKLMKIEIKILQTVHVMKVILKIMRQGNVKSMNVLKNVEEIVL
jgi:hypothetical protein